MEKIPLVRADVRRDLHFLAEGEAQVLRDRLLSEIAWEQHDVIVYGKTYKQPRLVAWFGTQPYSYSGLSLAAKTMPNPVDQLRQKVEAATGRQFNSVLLNRYVEGQNHGIGFHADNEPELGPNPVIAMVTLGEGRALHFKPGRWLAADMPHLGETKVETPAGSLLVMAGGTQKNWLHGLPKKRGQERITLTFRTIYGA